MSIIEAVRVRRCAQLFLGSMGTAEYRDRIPNPLDLKVIESNVRNGVYKNCWEFYRDMSILFDNAVIFHGVDSLVALAINAVRHDFERRAARLDLGPRIWAERMSQAWEKVAKCWGTDFAGFGRELGVGLGLPDIRAVTRPAWVVEHRGQMRRIREGMSQIQEPGDVLSLKLALNEVGCRWRTVDNVELVVDPPGLHAIPVIGAALREIKGEAVAPKVQKIRPKVQRGDGRPLARLSGRSRLARHEHGKRGRQGRRRKLG